MTSQNCDYCSGKLSGKQFTVKDEAGPALKLECPMCLSEFWVGEHEHCDGDCAP